MRQHRQYEAMLGRWGAADAATVSACSFGLNLPRVACEAKAAMRLLAPRQAPTFRSLVWWPSPKEGGPEDLPRLKHGIGSTILVVRRRVASEGKSVKPPPPRED